MAQSTMAFTWSGGKAEFGKQLTINITRDSQSYRHQLLIYFNDVLQTTLYGVTNMATYTPPMSLIERIPRNTQATFKVLCYTFNGSGQLANPGTLIGQQTKSETIYVPDSVVPTISSVSLSDPTGFLGTYGAYVAGRSKIQAVISAAGVYGSVVEQYKLSIGSTYDASSFTNTVTIENIGLTGDINVTATALDSRNRYKQLTQKVKVAPYSAPSLAGSLAKRWSGSAEDDDSSTVRVFVKGSILDVNGAGKNTGTVKVETASYGSGSWTTRDTRDVGNGEFDYTIDVSGLSNNSRWQVRITATDSLGVVTQSITTIETASAVMDIRGSGRGVAFGKVAEQDELLDVDYSASFKGNIKSLGMNYVTRGAGQSGTLGFIRLCVITAKEKYGNSPIRLTVTSRRRHISFIDIIFNSQNDTNLTVNSAVAMGGVQFYYSTSGSTCEIYALKSEAWDEIAIIDFQGDPGYMGTRINYSFPMDLYTNLPSNYVQVEKNGFLLDYVFPIGSVVIRYDNQHPGSLYGGGWLRIEGRFLYATSTGGTIGATGGSGTHTLTVNEIPSHNHQIILPVSTSWVASGGAALALESHQTGTISNNGSDGRYVRYTGGGQAHNNNPAFINVAVWRRVD